MPPESAAREKIDALLVRAGRAMHSLPTPRRRACQIEAITQIEASSAADHPRALTYVHNRRFTRAASIITNIAHLTAAKFAEIEFPLPPLAEQMRIVAEVERRRSVVEELETVVNANLKRANRLRQSILQKVFTS